MVTVIYSTIPEREKQLDESILTLMPQADHFMIQRNEAWGELPGSSGRILEMGEARGRYVLLADDDLLFPPDYVEKITAGIDKYGCVSYHGRKFHHKHTDSYSYYTHQNEYAFRCRLPYAVDLPLDVPGTGVFGIAADLVPDLLDNLPPIDTPFASDLHLAIGLLRAGITPWGLAHPGNWIIYNPPEGTTIYDALGLGNDQVPTRLFNEYLRLRNETRNSNRNLETTRDNGAGT